MARMVKDGNAQLYRKLNKRPYDRLANDVVVVQFDACEAAALDATPHFIYGVLAVPRIYETVAKHASRKAAHGVIDPLATFAKRLGSGRTLRRQNRTATLMNFQLVVDIDKLAIDCLPIGAAVMGKVAVSVDRLSSRLSGSQAGDREPGRDSSHQAPPRDAAIAWCAGQGRSPSLR